MNDPVSITRQFQIDLISDTPNPIMSWFIDLWAQIHKVEVNVLHQGGDEFIYYIKDPLTYKKKAIFYLGRHVEKSSHIFLSCSKDYYWDVLWDKLNRENEYNLESDYEYSIMNNISNILLGHINENMLTNRDIAPYFENSLVDVNTKKALNSI